jgi:hypothetical protein
MLSNCSILDVLLLDLMFIYMPIIAGRIIQAATFSLSRDAMYSS